MATSEHGEEAEIAASILQNPGKPPLEHACLDLLPEGSLSIVQDTSEAITREGERSLTRQSLGAFFH